jgi:hypothetical protein
MINQSTKDCERYISRQITSYIYRLQQSRPCCVGIPPPSTPTQPHGGANFFAVDSRTLH